MYFPLLTEWVSFLAGTIAVLSAFGITRPYMHWSPIIVLTPFLLLTSYTSGSSYEVA